MKIQKVWIRISDHGEKEEAQRFILSLAKEELLGDIPVTLFMPDARAKFELSHVYDVSEKALIPLYEKFGEENVRLVEHEMHSCNVERDCFSQPDSMERIADSLERIADALENIDSNFGDCISRNHRDEAVLCVGGLLDMRRIN